MPTDAKPMVLWNTLRQRRALLVSTSRRLCQAQCIRSCSAAVKVSAYFMLVEAHNLVHDKNGPVGPFCQVANRLPRLRVRAVDSGTSEAQGCRLFSLKRSDYVRARTNVGAIRRDILRHRQDAWHRTRRAKAIAANPYSDSDYWCTWYMQHIWQDKEWEGLRTCRWSRHTNGTAPETAPINLLRLALDRDHAFCQRCWLRCITTLSVLA